MDSFYDAPRRAPVPTQVEKFLPAPVVPEVSIICSSKTPTNKYLSYNSWKTHQNRPGNTSILTSNGENVVNGLQKFSHGQFPCPQNTSQLLKKQVRFESPVLQQRPSLTYEPFNTRKIVPRNFKDVPTTIDTPLKNCEKSNEQQNKFPLNGATFEQIYLANIPNRNLDLSLIELPNKLNKNIDENSKNQIEKHDQIEPNDFCKANVKNAEDIENNACENKENVLPKTYRDFLETQKKITKENLNDSVTDIFNYKRKNFSRENMNQKPKEFLSELNLTKPKTDPGVSSKINENTKFSNSSSPNFNMERQQTQSPAYENYRFHFSRPQSIQNIKNFGHSSNCDGVTQTSIVYTGPEKSNTSSKQIEVTKDDSEPTNRDLLKIIAQQNEQLIILQRQVAMLLNRDDQHRPKQIEAASRPCQNCLGEKCVTSTQTEFLRNPIQEANNTPRKQRGLSKFSIDLMTSFEVAIRPQHNKQNFINHEPKIQEITESDSGMRDSASAVDKCDKTIVDTSLHLQEPVKVREMCPSPEPSININMNDYDSSDDDEVSASEIGATFYHNLMGQVNDILRKAHGQTKEDNQNCVDSFKNQTMDRVKEATLKHLKNIGVTIGPIEELTEEVSTENGSKDYTPTEISFAVKQLLLKYLPDEQLAKITCKRTKPVPFNKPAKPGIIPNRPEFSFASYEYMKKYNLINSNKDTKPKDADQNPKASNPQKPEVAKILDMTALKMQPKLL